MRLKNWIIILLLTLVVWPGAAFQACAAPEAQSRAWHTPQPPYPGEALARHVQGSGVVQLTTDARGRAAKVAMKQSTGSPLLDGSIVAFSKANWSGPPNGTSVVPVTYRLAAAKPTMWTPRSPYPIAARVRHLEGAGVVQFTTDTSGKVVRAVILRSTGSSVLDDNTTNFALANWHGPPNHTGTVPFSYRIP